MTAMQSRRLYLHIGLQKTGTSYLQSIMWRNEDLLRELGLDLVPPSKRETFHLMLDVRERYRPEFDPPAVATALERLPAQLAAASGPTALISEESLAPAGDQRIGDLLAACAEREVHLIVTLRDLGRQIPSAWQQTLQDARSLPYAEYLRRLRTNEGAASTKLWNSKDVAGILERWSRHVPADRIHLVTVPPQGSPQGTLLERYCRVLGVDPDPGRAAAPGERPADPGVPLPRRLRRHRQALPRGTRPRSPGRREAPGAARARGMVPRGVAEVRRRDRQGRIPGRG
jgi:hypothetical protein